MLLKRFLNARREKKLVLTQLILPLLMVCLTLLLIKTLQESMQNEPPRILNLSNLSIKGVPNIGFYADFRPSVDPNKKNALFDVSWRFLRSLIERFRFKDDDDYEYEIWLEVFRTFLKYRLPGKLHFTIFSLEKLALLPLVKKATPSPDRKVIKLLTFDNLFPPLRHSAKTRGRVKTATTFSRQNEAGSRACTTKY